MRTLDATVRPDPPPARDWPAYWFVCLERALTEGDYAAASAAKQELRRLGMDVTIRLLPRQPASA